MNGDPMRAVRQAAATHRESLRKNVQRRLDVARRNGDEKLVRQIEAEANYLRLDL